MSENDSINENKIENDIVPLERHIERNYTKSPYRPPHDDERCSATNKKTGERCKNYRVSGEKVCRYHGASLSNRIKHKLATSGKPLNDQIKKYTQSSGLLNMTKQIALLRIMLDEYTNKLSTDDLAKPEIRSDINLMSQSIANIVLKLTQAKKNAGDYLDHMQIFAMMKQYTSCIKKAMSIANLTPEQSKIFLDTFFAEYDKIQEEVKDDFTDVEQ